MFAISTRRLASFRVAHFSVPARNVRTAGNRSGGGIRAGQTYGRSDDYGYEAAEHPVSIADLHATQLAALGLDHTQLTFNHAGRDFRLTDVQGRVVKKLFAS